MGRLRLSLAIALLATVALRSPSAEAQTQIKPYMLILVDTSSSMLAEMVWGGFNDETFGDGSRDAPYHADFDSAYPGRDRNGDGEPDDSRIYIAKSVMAEVIASTGDIIFGLERYHQQESPLCFGNNDCIACGSLGIVSPLYFNNMNGPDACATVIGGLVYTLDYLSYRGFWDRPAGACRDVDGSGRMNDPGGDILVTIQDDNQNRILRWMNHSESFVHGGGDSGRNWSWVDPPGPEGVNWSKELRANGFTPLARSIDSARTYLEPLFDAEPLVDGRVCRPYSVVVLTDGEDTCGGNPVTAVENLCRINGGLPRDPLRCSIKTYVIALALDSVTMQNMATAGSTGYDDFLATDEDTLAASFSEIIADTVLVEVCNGRDDDCDGLIDEGVTNACGGCGPLVEVCNRIDDDCDGLTDEGFTLYCDRPGGHPAADLCVDPGERVCDGVDDNCNGIIDEGDVCGGCRPEPEVCDNRDNDCDRLVDENLQRACGTDLGECTVGVQDCVAGVWGWDRGAGFVPGACSGQGPVPEDCNGLDDDCDGAVDGQVRPCGIDVGECSPGVRACDPAPWGPCVGEQGPVPEICDGLDNDCDGVDDNGNPGGGARCGTNVGECEEGVYRCIGGALVCDDVGPSPEICDGLDNNCDGLTDEGNPEGGAPCGMLDVGECEDGVWVCLGGDLVCDGWVGPVPEICDDRDNDCDGAVDEGNPGGGDECGTDVGECEPGTLECIDGDLVCVDEVGPEDEICDGLDNDCDREVDEGIPVGAPCGSDIGECEPGNIACVDGEEDCVGGVGPTDEICDGLDNDCDGAIDEGLGLGDECGEDEGECEPGNLECVAGEVICVGGIGPVDEQCDCEDNDCDGETDEDNPCPEGSRCIDCSCALPCADNEFPCPVGRVCEDGWCVGDLCRPDGVPIECPEGQECRDGVCEDLCAGVVCDAPLVCHEGRCVPNDCYHLGCEDGEACVDGDCVPHPCAGVECLEDEYCRDGDCVGLCNDVECEEGQRCVDGECVDDPCFGVECADDRICVDGTCEDDPCRGMGCPVGRICVDGECVDDPCLVTVCPDGFLCDDGVCEPKPTGDGDGGPGADGGPTDDRRDVFVTGKGGCACAVGSTGGTGPVWLGCLVLLGVLARRRRGGMGTGRGPWLAVVAVAATALAASGCEVDPYCIEDCEGATGPDDDAGPLPDGGGGDAGEDGGGDGGIITPDACDPEAEEICNGFDDDCDGEIDEDFDLDDDPRNCGECGNACTPAHAFPACEDGECGMGDCDVGWIDFDGEPENGCEYHCTPTRADDALCDARDNDCDQEVDEDVDLETDPENCGACGFRCRPLHGTGRCIDSECEIESCDEDWWDDDGVYGNGCEYSCHFLAADELCNLEDDDCNGEIDEGNPEGGAECGETDVGECAFGTSECVGGRLECPDEVVAVAELCNGLDDDCDDEIDEGNPQGGAVCGTDQGECVAGRMTCQGGGLRCVGDVGPVDERCDGRDNDCDGEIDEGNPDGGDPCGTDVGECEFGAMRCVPGGAFVCDGGVDPVIEECDGLDNDCDRLIDETFDLNFDKNNCGECGVVCDLPHAFERCDAGDGDAIDCEFLSCESGWYDRNRDPYLDGCEYECDYAGAEVCNGQDDDCDGDTDEGLVPPANYCNPNGACAGTSATCDGVDGWVCNYPASVQTDGDGNIVPETWCDGIDNDCDGPVDESHPLKNSVCFNGDGECRRFGVYVCDGMNREGPVVCNAPPAGAPGTEVCNGLDDDCDRAVDEGIALANMNAAHVDPPGVGNDFWIFRYEASRPDAEAGDPGTDGTVACSRSGVMPWSDVTRIEAQAACAALNTGGISGWRLCDSDDWQYTCQRGASWAFPYHLTTYNPSTCNGNDWDCDGVTPGDQDCLYASGLFIDCRAVFGGGVGNIYDLSGNLKEWTATERPAMSRNYEIRGGSYNNVEPGLRCDFDFTLANESFSFPNLGFRCCNYP